MLSVILGIFSECFEFLVDDVFIGVLDATGMRSMVLGTVIMSLIAIIIIGTVVGFTVQPSKFLSRSSDTVRVREQRSER